MAISLVHLFFLWVSIVTQHLQLCSSSSWHSEIYILQSAQIVSIMSSYPPKQLTFLPSFPSVPSPWLLPHPVPLLKGQLFLLWWRKTHTQTWVLIIYERLICLFPEKEKHKVLIQISSNTYWIFWQEENWKTIYSGKFFVTHNESEAKKCAIPTIMTQYSFQ